MSSDEDVSLRLLTVRSKLLPAYNYERLASNVGSVKTAGAVYSALSSDSHVNVSTDTDSWLPGRLCYLFHGPWFP